MGHLAEFSISLIKWARSSRTVAKKAQYVELCEQTARVKEGARSMASRYKVTSFRPLSLRSSAHQVCLPWQTWSGSANLQGHRSGPHVIVKVDKTMAGRLEY